MNRASTFLLLACLIGIAVARHDAKAADNVAGAATTEIRGAYMEARTCQVYTGPCFANGEVGLTGRDAIMAWAIDEGAHKGVDLSGLHVIVALNTTDTLGFLGMKNQAEVKSVILVDERAVGSQREALIDFAKSHAGRAGDAVVRVDSAPIEMNFDFNTFSGTLTAGKAVRMTARKAVPSDCICSNESAYYPPLAKVNFFAPGVMIEGGFKGRGLGSQWTANNSRNMYLGLFTY